MEPETAASPSPAGGDNKTLWIVAVVIIIAIAAYMLTRGGTGTTSTAPPGTQAGVAQ